MGLIAGSLLALFLALYVLAYVSPLHLGVPVAAAVRGLFLPLHLLGLAIGLWAYFTSPQPARRGLLNAGWIIFLAADVAVIAFAEKSSILFLHYEATLLVFPFLLAALGIVGSCRIATGRAGSGTRPAALAAGALGLIVVGVVWSPPLLGDLFAPRTQVEGVVTAKLEALKPRRAYSTTPTSYQIKIDGPPRWRTRRAGTLTFQERIEWYYVTRDVYAELAAGDRVRALAGAGTGVLVAVRKLL